MRRRRLHKRYKKNPGSDAPKRNPPDMGSIAEDIVPGFAAFAGSRLATRIATTQVAKVKPSIAKHVGALTSLAAFAAAWLLAHRVGWMSKYQRALVVGTGLASLQSLLQSYVPKLGWMVADATPDLPAAVAETQIAVASNGRRFRMDELQELDEDPNEFVYDDSFDAGRLSRENPAPSGEPQQKSDEDLLADLSDLAPQGAGIFS